MPTQIAEALVILSPSAPADVAATVQAQARLTQRLPGNGCWSWRRARSGPSGGASCQGSRPS